jgi:hypothetical protein
MAYRTACGFGDMDDESHVRVCMTCRAASAPEWVRLTKAVVCAAAFIATPFLWVLWSTHH